MKKCSLCQINKPLDEFSRHKGKKDGRSSKCLICLRQVSKVFREKNKNNEKDRVYKFLKNNPEYRKIYMRDYNKKKRSHDSLFKLIHNIRVRIKKFLKSENIIKKNKTFDIIGCNPDFLKNHIESKFTNGMSWDKIGIEIHIDHIIPLSSAKNEDEIYKLCHYTNLQPLWAKDNLKKGNKIKL